MAISLWGRLKASDKFLMIYCTSVVDTYCSSFVFATVKDIRFALCAGGVTSLFCSNLCWWAQGNTQSDIFSISKNAS